jgi:hypothetical protein
MGTKLAVAWINAVTESPHWTKIQSSCNGGVIGGTECTGNGRRPAAKALALLATGAATSLDLPSGHGGAAGHGGTSTGGGGAAGSLSGLPTPKTDCVVAVHADECCSQPVVASAAALSADPCLVPYGLERVPSVLTSCPAATRCSSLNCVFPSPTTRIAEPDPGSPGACRFCAAVGCLRVGLRAPSGRERRPLHFDHTNHHPRAERGKVHESLLDRGRSLHRPKSTLSIGNQRGRQSGRGVGIDCVSTMGRNSARAERRGEDRDHSDGGGADERG